MTRKFNTKTYQGKSRVYTAVLRAPRISRLWVWSETEKEYRTPDRGNIYYAARYTVGASGEQKRVHGSFMSLDEARNWQTLEQPLVVAPVSQPESQDGPLFREVVQEWRKRRLCQLAHGTQIQYEKIIRLHFGDLLALRVHEISAKRVDQWLDQLKAWNLTSSRCLARHSFDHELSLLSTILKYYVNYNDDTGYQFPIKQRHRDAMWVTRAKTGKPKDLSEIDFLKFRDALQAFKHGPLVARLATVQYYQALRISEAAGLFWEDIHLDWNAPENSRLKIVRSVCYPHKTGAEAFIKGGFKNATSNQGVKEQPMFPETFAPLAELYRDGADGLIFALDGKPLSYMTIQSHYNRAFKRAGLPFRGTHVMRHGGCRRVFNEMGDLSIAQQLLGNSDMKTTLVYAKRQASALTKVAHQHWDKRKLNSNVRLIANDCISRIENRK